MQCERLDLWKRSCQFGYIQKETGFFWVKELKAVL